MSAKGALWVPGAQKCILLPGHTVPWNTFSGSVTKLGDIHAQFQIVDIRPQGGGRRPTLHVRAVYSDRLPAGQMEIGKRKVAVEMLMDTSRGDQGIRSRARLGDCILDMMT